MRTKAGVPCLGEIDTGSGFPQDSGERFVPLRVIPTMAGAPLDLNEATRALKPPRCVPAALAGSARPDPRLLWMPEQLAPLYGTPSYGRLSPGERRTYNQYCAMHMAEQFIWLERFFILAPIVKLLERGRIPDRYLAILRSLVADEENHNTVFWNLLELARPDLYAKPGFRSFRVPARVAWAARLAEQCPRLLSSWVLLANYFEERSILVYREYDRAGSEVDGVFARVHALHAQDEARHCNLERLTAEWLLEGQGKAASQLNAWFLADTLRTYHDPSWGFDTAVRALVRDHPALEGSLPAFLDDAVRAHGPEYRRRLFDRGMAPITDRNRARFPILDSAIRRLD